MIKRLLADESTIILMILQPTTAKKRAAEMYVKHSEHTLLVCSEKNRFQATFINFKRMYFTYFIYSFLSLFLGNLKYNKIQQIFSVQKVVISQWNCSSIKK